jgi:hypothetical protein
VAPPVIGLLPSCRPPEMDFVAASRHNGAVTEGDGGAGGQDEASFDELVEIERATALIQDRDPGQAEAVVAARMLAKAERQKRDEQLVKVQEAGRRKERRRKRKIIAIVLSVIAVGGAGYPLSKYIREETRRSDALRKLLDDASDGARKQGFKSKKDWSSVDTSGVALAVPKGTCSVIVAVREGGGSPGPIRVERQRAKAIEGAGGHVWCSCDDEEVTVRPVDGAAHPIAVRWLTAGTVALGGVEVLATVNIPGLTLRVDDFGRSCSDQAFEAWSAKEKHGRIPEVPAKRPEWIEPLLAEGFAPVGMLAADRQFAVIDVKGGQCMLATAKEQTGTVTLRAQDGKRLVKRTAASLTWCCHGDPTRHTLWRDEGPATDWVVLSIEAKRIGGMAGLRDLAKRQSLELVGGIAPSELAADAEAALLASSVAKDSMLRGGKDGLTPKPEHRVVAFSMLRAGAYVADETAMAPMGCHPLPDPKATMNAFVCVQARPQRWRPEGSENTQAAVSAKLPYWMSVLADATDPKALQAAAQLLGFARRMAARGAEPSSAFGVQDMPWGAKIRGHANKKTVVAVGITKTAPWIHPLTSDASWTLDGPAPMAEVAADGDIELRSKLPLGFNAGARRVVAWRR